TPDARATSLERYPATFRRLVLRHPWRVLRGMASMGSTLASGRRAFRPRYENGHELTNGFIAVRIEAPDAERMRAAMKAWQVTQNDLVLAMLMQALAPLTQERRHAKRRRNLAIASIVNLRGEFDASPTTTFGQFLSSFHVSHSVPDGTGLE